MRYAVVGSGAVGGLYGGMLAHHGQDVHFLLRSDFDHVTANGLRIDSIKGDFVLPKPNIYQRAEDMPRCDVVIVALKSTNNAMLAETLPKIIAEDGVVLTLQNGLDVEADSVSAVPGHGVLGGCCFLCSNKVGPGHIHHLDYGRIVFGGYEFVGRPDQICEIGQRIASEMTDAGIDVQWTDDLAAARWRKLMWNVPFNGLSVVLDASTDAIIGCPASRTLADRIIKEVYAGAALCGVSIEEGAIEKTMRHTETMVPYDSSMRLDFLNGRPMEVDAIFGSPLRAVERRIAELTAESSEKLAHPMPSVKMLREQLQFLDSRPATASNLSG